MRVVKPFDSKIEHTRDDGAPVLEFRYRGTRMSPFEGVAATVLAAMIFTAPFALIPFLRSRLKHRHLRLDADTLVVGKARYERRHVQRVRVVRFAFNRRDQANPPVVGIVFDYGVRWKGIAGRLSEPELLWMHDEIEDFIGMHWGEKASPGV